MKFSKKKKLGIICIMHMDVNKSLRRDKEKRKINEKIKRKNKIRNNICLD